MLVGMDVGEHVEREILLGHPPEEVWLALVDSARLSMWFGAEGSIDPTPGGRAVFRWPDGTERRALVERCEPHRILVWRWLPFERAPDGRSRTAAASRVEIRLTEEADGTLLRVVETRQQAMDPGPGVFTVPQGHGPWPHARLGVTVSAGG